MNIPTWIKPALVGAGVGAVALAIVGFNWGGWVTASTAEKMAETSSETAVVSTLTPYCVKNARLDPQSATLIEELGAAKSYNRRGIVEKAGWATPLGAEKPNSALARSCEEALMASAAQ